MTEQSEIKSPVEGGRRSRVADALIKELDANIARQQPMDLRDDAKVVDRWVDGVVSGRVSLDDAKAEF